MAIAKCPHCNTQDPTFGIYRILLGTHKKKDNTEEKIETDVLYCKKCGAVFCQLDPAKYRPSVI